MPMDRSKYPDNWEAISQRIRFERAQGRCESCGAPHLEHIGRYKDNGAWWKPWDDVAHAHRHKWKRVKVVLTTAHLDHDTANNTDDNLKALCQRCHLLYDKDRHRKTAARNRKAAKDRQMGRIVEALGFA